MNQVVAVAWCRIKTQEHTHTHVFCCRGPPLGLVGRRSLELACSAACITCARCSRLVHGLPDGRLPADAQSSDVLSSTADRSQHSGAVNTKATQLPAGVRSVGYTAVGTRNSFTVVLERNIFIACYSLAVGTVFVAVDSVASTCCWLQEGNWRGGVFGRGSHGHT